MFKLPGLLNTALSIQLIFSSWMLSASLAVQDVRAENNNDSSNPNSSANISSTKNNSGSVNLDLSSSTASISGSVLGQEVSVNFGGQASTITSTSVLTPAQYLAALSVLNTGSQTLTVNSSGQAVSGSFQLPASTTYSAVSVPQGVTGVYDFAASQNLNLTGNFVNSGSFYLVSTNQAVNSGSLNALNIINNPGALISSVLPAGGLLGLSNLVSNVSFSLNAVNNITNYGSITSAGALNLTAGNQISNIASNALANANISALSNINMIAPNITNQGQITATLNNINVQAANMVNSGIIESAKGDLSITNLVQNVLDINNVGGLISASDTLAFLNSSSSTNSSINLDGGVLNAAEISFTDRRGSVNVSVEDSSPNLSFRARNVSLTVENGSKGLNLTGLNRARSVELNYSGAGDLYSGAFKTRGKDVFVETTGSINISGKITSSPQGKGDGGSVYLSAGKSLNVGDITSNGRRRASDGGNITLIAGLDLNAGNLKASGGKNGAPGLITIDAGQLGSGNADIRSIEANGKTGAEVTISAPGNINVDRSISAIDGTVTLNSSSTSIGSVEVGRNGHLNINPYDSGGQNGGGEHHDQPYVLNLEELASFGSGIVNVGAKDIVLTGNCINCLGNLSSLSINTEGSFSATGTVLTLDQNQSFYVYAAESINTGSVSGGQSISFQSEGIVTVDGIITSKPGGSVTLSGSGFALNSKIDVGSGSVTLAPTGESTTIAGAQLSNITGANLFIGQNTNTGGSVTITGNTDLSHISSHVGVQLSGNFNTEAASLSLANNASMVVNATNVSVGNISGGSALVLNARDALSLSGNLNLPNGPVILNGDLAGTGNAVTLQSGSAITASAISVTSNRGDIISGARLNATATDLYMSSGGALSILESSQLSAAKNLSLSSNSDLSIGAENGSSVSISAGSLSKSFDPFSAAKPFNPSQDLGKSSGNIMIDTYRSGNGTGNVNIGSNVSMVAAGTDGRGNLGILSGGDINIASGSKLAAVGGNLWLSATADVNIDGGTLLSLASRNADAKASYSGGQLGIMAGAPQTDMQALLANLAASRSGSERINSDVSLSRNTISMNGSSLLTVVSSDTKQVNLESNTFTLTGGVLFIDPPPTSEVNISNSNIIAIGPGIASSGGSGGGNTQQGGATVPPVIVPAVTNVGSTSSFSSGASTPLLLSPQSSVNATDTQRNNNGNGNQNFTAISGSSTALPSDTLEEGQITPSMKSGSFCSKPQLLKCSDTLDEDSWIIASSSCQPFTFEEHDGSLIVGTGPAKFAPSQDRTLLLREGKILVITVDKIHVVRTPYCNITIPVNTASIIEVDPQGLVRIANLAGGKTSITICRNDETLILAAAPGEQLVLAENSVSSISEEQFSTFSFPEVSHQKVSAWNLEISGLRGQKVKFDRQQMAQNEPLLHCSMGCVNQNQLRRLEQLMQSMTSEFAVLKSMEKTRPRNLIQSALPQALNKLRPVSFNESELKGILSFNTLNAGNALIKYTGKCRFSLTSPGLILLEEGEALVSAKKKTVVKAGQAHVEMKAGTVAVINYQDGLLKVRNIYEKKNTAVITTVANKRVIGLQVGQELIIGRRGISLNRTLSQDPVGRRRLNSLDLKSGHTCISSEISLSSLLQNSSILCQLIRSNDEQDREMASKIMKIAVCLSLVTSSHGNYSMVNP